MDGRTGGGDRGPAVPRRGRAGEPRPLVQIPVWGPPPSGVPAPAPDPGGTEALLAGLNREQRRAVLHGEGPLLVVAGAGTGKTQVITRRIAWLVATRRARPSEILALTFTDQAADEMQTRVDQLVPYGYADTAISTFHAFGDRLVREHALELGLPSDPRVLSRPETVVLLREHVFELGLDEYRPLGDPTRFLEAFATLCSRAKDEDVSPEAYRAHAVRLAAEAAAAAAGKPPAAEAAAGGTRRRRGAAVDPRAGDPAVLAEEARRQAELADGYARYQELLRSRGALDFGDQVALALELLRGSPSALAAVQRRFRYVLVDEFQDTNRAQAELVALVAARHGNITVVGDDDQSIYRFRGAAISNILEFRQRHQRARVVVLRRNYRSRAPILDASYRLVRHNDPDRLEVRVGIPKRLVPVRRGRGAVPVRHLAFASGSEEADWIAGEIARRTRAGMPARDAAVLVRANASADPILRSLNIAGIPWRFPGTSGLHARPEIRLLRSLLRAAADPGSDADVYALAASDLYDVPAHDLAALVREAAGRHRPVLEVMAEAAARGGRVRLAPPARAAVGRLVTELGGHVALARDRPAGELLYAFLRDSGWLARLAAAGTVGAEQALSNIARFFDLVRSHSALLADDRAVFLARHLDALVDAGDDPATADLDPDADAVAVMTVHKAKGLEFPLVFLPGLVAGRFPATGRRETLPLPPELVAGVLPTGDHQLQEERRLFYVAMTRARDELVLTHAADYGGVRTRRVSPFVLEALDLPATAAPTGSGARAASALDRIGALERSEPPAGPARRPAEGPLTLSYSAIDDYRTCPQRYRYGHLLRLPSAPHHAAVYGSALHAAVSAYHRRELYGERMTEDALVGVFEATWRNEGFLSRAHEEARLAAGRAALARFREARPPGTRAPAYVEREFTFLLGGDRIVGRYDRVDVGPRAPETGDRQPGPPAPAGEGGVAEAPAPIAPASGADVVEPTLGLAAEHVVVTDYKSSEVRDPAKARERARDSLQLAIYAMAWEAASGRLPDEVALHYLDTGIVGSVPVEAKRIARARDAIGEVAAGIRAEAFAATPDPIACRRCPYRSVCPESAGR